MERAYLKDLRLKAGYTQQEVADMIGVTKATISKLENGQRSMRSPYIEKLSSIYNVEPFYILFGRSSQEFNNQLEKERKKTEEVERLYWESILLPKSAKKIKVLLDRLNDLGQQKAVERVEELTEIPKYQKKEEPEQK